MRTGNRRYIRTMMFLVSPLLFVVITSSTVLNAEFCNSPQFLEFHTEGAVKCTFPVGFYGVYWYDKTGVTVSDWPILSLTDGVDKRGTRLYPTGELDISPNGSMIITSVSNVHDRTFSVGLVEDKTQQAVFEQIRVRVYVRPDEPYPMIDGCVDNGTCYRGVSGPTNLTCLVSNARPPLKITWVSRTIEGYIALSSTADSSSTIVAPLNDFSPALELLVCNVTSEIPSIEARGKEILVERINQGMPGDYVNVPSKLGARLVIQCGETPAPISFLVWRKDSVVIATGIVNSVDEWVVTTYGEIPLSVDDTSLVIPEFEESMAGRYVCVHSDGNKSEYERYDVSTDAGTRSLAWIVAVVMVGALLLFILVVLVVLVRRKRRYKSKPYECVLQNSDRDGINRQKNVANVVPVHPAKLTDEAIAEFCKDIAFRSPENESSPYTTYEDNVLLLERANGKKVAVKFLEIMDCFERIQVDGTELSIVLVSDNRIPISDYRIPKIPTLKEIGFSNSLKRTTVSDDNSPKRTTVPDDTSLERTTVLDDNSPKRTTVPDDTSLERTTVLDDHFKLILKYASRCEEVKVLRFRGYLLPFSLDVHGLGLRDGFMVKWVTDSVHGTPELKNGCWFKNDGRLSEEEYEDIKSLFAKCERSEEGV